MQKLLTRRSFGLGLLSSGLALTACQSSRSLDAGVFAANASSEDALPVSLPEINAELDKKLKAQSLRYGAETFVRIFKREAQLEVWVRDGAAFRRMHTYPICAFSGDLGPKLKEGDLQSPEGFYVVSRKQLNPNSRFHLSFNIAFPNEYDRAHGRTGSALMVHGDCVSIGCYAMTDPGIDEIYNIVEAAQLGGQKRVPVHIFPFRMTQANMAAAKGARWESYWANLKEGYDLFERTKIPPVASVCNKRYVFNATGQTGCQEISGW